MDFGLLGFVGVGIISIAGAVVTFLASLKSREPPREPCSPEEAFRDPHATSNMPVSASQSLIAARSSRAPRSATTRMAAGSSGEDESWTSSDDRALSHYLRNYMQSSKMMQPERGRVKDLLHSVESAFVILFNPEMTNEGVYTLSREDNSPGLLVFELEEDAERFAGLLEAAASDAPKVRSKTVSWISEFSEGLGNDIFYVKMGCMMLPPKVNNFDPNAWDASGQLDSFKSAREAASRSPILGGTPSSDSKKPLDSFRFALETAYRSPSVSGAPGSSDQKKLDSSKSAGEAAPSSPSVNDAPGSPSSKGGTWNVSLQYSRNSSWNRRGPPADVFDGIDAAWVLICDQGSRGKLRCMNQSPTGEIALVTFVDMADAERYAQLLQARGLVLDDYTPTLIDGVDLIAMCKQDQIQGMLEMPGSLATPPDPLITM